MEDRMVNKLFVVLLLLFVLPMVSASLNDDIVGYWKFDENTGSVAIDAVYGAEINLAASDRWTSSGKINAGYSNNGAGDPNPFDNPNVAFGGSGTVALWFYDTKGDSNERFALLGSNQTGSTSDRLWMFRGTDGQLGVRLGTSSRVGGIFNHDADTWYHFALTWSGTDYVVYVNANVEASGTFSGGVGTLDQFFFGGATDDNNMWDGHLDELGLWSRSLSAEEIEELYNNNAGMQYPFVFPEGINIFVTDFFTDEPLNDITASFKNGKNFTNSTSNSLFITDMDYSFHNDTLTLKSTNYVDKSFLFLLTEGSSDDILIDRSSNNYNLTNNGATLVDGLNPWSQYAYEFDGVSDYILLPKDASVRGKSQVTLSMWIEPVTGLQKRIYDESTPSGATVNRFAVLMQSSGRVIFQGRSNDSDSNTIWVHSDIALQSNEKHHLVLIFDSVTDTHWIYIDGVGQSNVVSATAFSDAEPHSGPVLGARANGILENINGIIDDVRIYDRVLSAGEIASLYSGDNIDTGLVAYYPFRPDYFATIEKNLWHKNKDNILISVKDWKNQTTLSTATGELNLYGLLTPPNPFLIKALDIWNVSGTLSYNNFIELNGTFTDQSFKHKDTFINFTFIKNKMNYDVIMNPVQFVMNFTRNGNPHSTSFILSSSSLENNTFSANATSLVVVQSQIASGKVAVRFGDSIAGNNWTQFYEYINTQTTAIDENMEVIVNPDWEFHVQAIDLSQAPINNAVVRVYQNFHTPNDWTSATLLGQRLTGDDGKTFFLADPSSSLFIQIFKDGYAPEERLVTIGDEIFTKEDPLKIFLTQGNINVFRNSWIYMPKYYNDSTQNVIGVINAKGHNRVEINTGWRESQLLPLIDITDSCNVFMECLITLVPNIHFPAGTNQTITTKVYLDRSAGQLINDALLGTWTTSFLIPSKNELFAFGELPQKITDVLLILGIIIVSIVAGLLIPHARSGFAAFTIATFLAGFISNLFWWGTAFMLLYIIGKFIQSAYKET